MLYASLPATKISAPSLNASLDSSQNERKRESSPGLLVPVGCPKGDPFSSLENGGCQSQEARRRVCSWQPWRRTSTSSCAVISDHSKQRTEKKGRRIHTGHVTTIAGTES